MLVVKNPPANAVDIRDVGLIPGLGRYPGVGNGYPLQYSCLESSIGRGACWAIVHGVAKSWTWLKRSSAALTSYPLSLCVFSHVWLFATPWIIACQDTLFMGLCRQEYWSGLPFPHPRDLPDPGIELTSPSFPAFPGRFITIQGTIPHL